MKKIILSILILSSLSFYGQEEKVKKKSHEVKLNAFNTLIFKSIDVSYEYLIDKESSVGLSVLINLDDVYSDGPTYYETFAITPFYRRYFSRKYAWGFFMEGFGMFNVQEDDYSGYYEDDVRNNSNKKTNNFALGISVGAKFVSTKGFAFEFFGGVGRNLFTSDSRYNYEFVPRLGVAFGYRF